MGWKSVRRDGLISGERGGEWSNMVNVLIGGAHPVRGRVTRKILLAMLVRSHTETSTSLVGRSSKQQSAIC